MSGNDGRAPSRGARFADWLDERVGHRRVLRELSDHAVPGGARWAYTLGSALATVFVLQLVTGLVLMTSYAPSATTAWASVHYVTYRLAAGWVVRGLHYYASQAMIVLLAAHLVQTAAAGAYRRPREVVWWLGLAMMGLTIALSHTGFMLPWDQKGYWAARMATGIAGTTPLVGPYVQQLIQGGAEWGNLTITRLYALHVGVLPLLFLLVVAAHVAAFRKHGVTPPPSVDRSKVEPFFPRQASMDVLAGVLVCAVLLAVVLDRHGAALDAPADPSADYPARPEWYLVPVFELRRRMHGPLEIVATMVIPGIAAGYLFALPFLDRAPQTATLRARLRPLTPLFVAIAGCLALYFLSTSSDARDPKLAKSRVKADAFAETAARIAMKGVSPAGPLDMLAHDPELRGQTLFAKSCASCHVLGGLGDKAKATASVLDGWGTERWAASMLDDPDAKDRFGLTPYKGMMPSMLRPPADRKPDDPPFKPMTDADVKAVSVFLASQSDEPSGKPARDPAELKSGESIVSLRCTTCHLWKGEGDDSTQGYAPELSGWGSDAWLRAQIANPATKATYRDDALSPKMKGHMPRFDAELTPADVDLVARWVVAHARGRTLD